MITPCEIGRVKRFSRLLLDDIIKVPQPIAAGGDLAQLHLVWERGGSCTFSPVAGQKFGSRSMPGLYSFHFIRPAVDAVIPPSQFIALSDIFLPRMVQALFIAGLGNFLWLPAALCNESYGSPAMMQKHCRKGHGWDVRLLPPFLNF